MEGFEKCSPGGEFVVFRGMWIHRWGEGKAGYCVSHPEMTRDALLNSLEHLKKHTNFYIGTNNHALQGHKCFPNKKEVGISCFFSYKEEEMEGFVRACEEVSSCKDEDHQSDMIFLER